MKNNIRRIILEQSKRAHVGHIGSCLSVAEIVGTLYDHVLHIPAPDDRDRDRFVLSKGHAALTLYAALFSKGWITEDDLQTFCGDETLLGVHPEHHLPGIDFSTGSLGHGLALGVGAALAARLAGSSRRTFVLISDAECNEGSTWEAAMFAAHHGLANLVCILDLNRQQALGYTDDILRTTSMATRWQDLGWDVHEVDGHDVEALTTRFQQLDFSEGQPHMVIAHTTFGKGVSFMESQIKWHYMPMSDEEYQQALSELA
ncbi:MAG: transketolase [Anaerolineales bacterium]